MSLFDMIKRTSSPAKIHEWTNQATYGGTYRGNHALSVNEIRAALTRCAGHDELNPLCQFCLEASVYRGELGSDQFVELLHGLADLGMLD